MQGLPALLSAVLPAQLQSLQHNVARFLHAFLWADGELFAESALLAGAKPRPKRARAYEYTLSSLALRAQALRSADELASSAWPGRRRK